MVDMVNHPPHYEQQSIRVEPIDILQFAPFDLGNALKYIIRSKHKGNELQDLKKAEFYLQRIVDNENFTHREHINWFAEQYGHLVRRFEGCETFEWHTWADVTRILNDVQERIAVLEK